MDVSNLKKVSKDSSSNVKSVKKEITVGIQKCQMQSVKSDVALYLNSKLHKYYEGIEGVLLGYEDIVIKDSVENKDFDIIHANIQATFYLFKPAVGAVLEGTVSSKKSSSLVVLVHEYIPAVCPASTKKTDIGDQVKVKISSVAYVDGKPHLMATIDGASSPTKRKGAQEAKKAGGKKAKTTSESEGTGESETSFLGEGPTKVPSSKPSVPKNLELPEGYSVIFKKTASKSWKEYEDVNGKRYRSVVEIYRSLGQEVPVKKTSPSTESKTKKAKGESAVSSKEKVTREEMTQEIEAVVNGWNMNEDGSLKKNKNKFYTGVSLEKLPKTEKFFTEAKSKGASNAKEKEAFANKEVEKVTSTTNDVVDHGECPSTPFKQVDANQTVEEGLNVTTKKPKKKKKKKSKDANTTL